MDNAWRVNVLRQVLGPLIGAMMLNDGERDSQILPFKVRP